MDRRGFLSSLLRATAGAAVAYSFPSVIVPKNIIPVETTVIRGIPYLADNTGNYFGVARDSFLREISEAQREYINSVIEVLHARESGFLERLQDPRPFALRGQRANSLSE